jgi:hypothetical protein
MTQFNGNQKTSEIFLNLFTKSLTVLDLHAVEISIENKFI